MFLHLVAHAVRQTRPLAAPEAAWWLWRCLRNNFPEAVAACLMPNHVHLLIAERSGDERIHTRRLGRVLGSHARRWGGGAQWQAADRHVIKGHEELRRQVRYVHLNPCRAKIVDDPLKWPWSTHRGIVGAEHDPWVPAARLARALARDSADFATWLHAYVSSDPTCAVDGTDLHAPLPARDVPMVPLATILAAAIAATPWQEPGLRGMRRHATVLLAWHQGWNDARVVAQAVRANADATRRLARRPNASLLRASLMCLGDARLRFTREQALPLLQSPCDVQRKAVLVRHG